jgi:hypothetical protein
LVSSLNCPIADFGLQMINPGRLCEWAADPDRDLEILVHHNRF